MRNIGPDNARPALPAIAKCGKHFSFATRPISAPLDRAGERDLDFRCTGAATLDFALTRSPGSGAAPATKR